ncbi:X-box binding protein 1 [Chamberlinius hualienensis]
MATKSSILITTSPFTGVGSNTPIMIKSEISEMSDDGPSRKRQRLDHLSFDEKVMRRKLKNRAAAQSARDRKKALMDIQEKQIFELNCELSQLKEENARLHMQNEQLIEDNKSIKLRLQEVEQKCQRIDEKEESKVVATCQPVEYASLISASLLKKQELTVAHRWMMLFVCWLMLNLTKSLTSCKNLDRKSLKTVLRAMLIHLEK